jgi:glutathione S-transferase
MPEEIRLYGIPLSHPVVAVRGMLERKGLPYRYIELLPGAHPPSLWALGFRRANVPAMKLPDGRRVQGSLAIARALEATAPDPPLFPREAGARDAAQDAERWAETVLQPVPRRLMRWGLRRSLRQRAWYVDVGTPLPAPQVAAVGLTPLGTIFAWQVGASDDRVRRDLAELRGLLDEVDRLVACGVIGGEELGAADFQIAASVRILLAMEDVRRLVKGRPAEAFARRVVPNYPDVPAVLPAEWIGQPT